MPSPRPISTQPRARASSRRCSRSTAAPPAPTSRARSPPRTTHRLGYTGGAENSRNNWEVRQMRYRDLKVATLVATMLTLSPLSTAAQDMSKYPDWSGQWAKPAGIGNGQWDITKPNGRGQEPPLTAEYRTIYEGRLAERASGG